jgi:UPF0755 protein
MSFVKIIFACLLLVFLTVGGFSFWIYSSMTSPHAHAKGNDFIVIEKGTPPGDIIDKLTAEDILTSPWAAKIYLRMLGNAEGLKAGEYQFASPITPMQVLAELEKGEERTVKLTIPEGFTRFDIAKRIVEKFGANRSPAEDGTLPSPIGEQQVLVMMDNTSLIRDVAPDAKNLEGYMYPSTYSLPRETKPEKAIQIMVEQFRKIWKPEWTEKARSMNRTPQEIVTIASLIETEAGVEGDRPIVASVIYNRLNKSIPLGIDQTVVYIAKMQNRWDGTINRSDLDADSPYNTRKYGGLPPGPISSVSESAINAALNPAQTDYLYYVRNVELNDGSHWFYSSGAEFEKGKAEYQRWLEKEREEKRANEGNN